VLAGEGFGGCLGEWMAGGGRLGGQNHWCIIYRVFQNKLAQSLPCN